MRTPLDSMHAKLIHLPIHGWPSSGGRGPWGNAGRLGMQDDQLVEDVLGRRFFPVLVPVQSRRRRCRRELVDNVGDPLDGKLGDDQPRAVELEGCAGDRHQRDRARGGPVEGAARLQLAGHALGAGGEVKELEGVDDAGVPRVEQRRFLGYDACVCPEGAEECVPLPPPPHVADEERIIAVHHRLILRVEDHQNVVHGLVCVCHIQRDAAARQEAFWGHVLRLVAVVGHKPVAVTCRTGGAF